jgi:predicted esterase
VKQAVRYECEAHYHLSHNPTFEEKEIWLVLHGYGQLAEFFVRKFKPFFSPDRLFVAPEGTNHSYLEGFRGRVGANWMTSHERETAIANNQRFLDTLLETIVEKYPVRPSIKVLGFSQGAATATRWAAHWGGKIDALVLWAGGFAVDLNLDQARNSLSETRLVVALGDQDELISEENLQKQEDLISSLNLTVERLSYAGGHELNLATLEKIINENK